MLSVAPGKEQAFYDDLLAELTRAATPKQDVHRLKLRLAKRHGLSRLPSDAEVLERATPATRVALQASLRVKPARTASGVAVVTVMTAPHSCPHGVCVFCPGGPRFGTPQSYTGQEIAARRAAELRYDPASQTASRVAGLQKIGHATDKVDLIILGGTFTALEEGYREWFVKGCLDGMNGFPSEDLGAAQAVNESAPSRCIGLTIETKPDCFLGPEVDHALRLGATKVELGLQSTHDDVLEFVHRGHTDVQSRIAIRRAKEAGLKVGVHMMTGLPRSTMARDFESFRRVFEDPAYRPDFLKIYPTLVLEGTALHGLWRSGRYQPPTLEETVELIARVKAIVPRWCRIQRIQREIGASEIRGGPAKGDLRVLAKERLRSQGLECQCVRCREAGFRGVEPGPDALALLDERYEASGGLEVFLSLEDPDRNVLVAYARLRIDVRGATVRELKVFGPLVPLHEAPGGRWQHRGFGRQLMAEAERIARDEFDATRLRVLSGVGVRGYYRTLGYRPEGPYMTRDL